MKCEVCKKDCQADESAHYNGVGIQCCSPACWITYVNSQAKKESKDRLDKLLHTVFNYPQPFDSVFYMQMEKICKEHGLSYGQLQKVIYYMYVIKHVPVYRPTLYYVKDYIQPAQKYYNELETKRKEYELYQQKKAAKPKPVEPPRPRPQAKRRPAGRKLFIEEEDE